MPPKRTTPEGYGRARLLRKTPTLAEAKLWAYLRDNKLKGVSFRRQHAIDPYIVDFCSPRRKLIIELDGSQHLHRYEYDMQRTMFLESQGYRVLRFWNDDVLRDINAVIAAISRELKDA